MSMRSNSPAGLVGDKVSVSSLKTRSFLLHSIEEPVYIFGSLAASLMLAKPPIRASYPHNQPKRAQTLN
jgi:hypothetical protein